MRKTILLFIIICIILGSAFAYDYSVGCNCDNSYTTPSHSHYVNNNCGGCYNAPGSGYDCSWWDCGLQPGIGTDPAWCSRIGGSNSAHNCNGHNCNPHNCEPSYACGCASCWNAWPCTLGCYNDCGNCGQGTCYNTCYDTCYDTCYTCHDSVWVGASGNRNYNCDNNWHNCDGSWSNGCERYSDFDNDPTNCGSCGNNCGDAPCIGGHCEPDQNLWARARTNCKFGGDDYYGIGDGSSTSPCLGCVDTYTQNIDTHTGGRSTSNRLYLVDGESTNYGDYYCATAQTYDKWGYAKCLPNYADCNNNDGAGTWDGCETYAGSLGTCGSCTNNCLGSSYDCTGSAGAGLTGSAKQVRCFVRCDTSNPSNYYGNSNCYLKTYDTYQCNNNNDCYGYTDVITSYYTSGSLTLPVDLLRRPGEYIEYGRLMLYAGSATQFNPTLPPSEFSWSYYNPTYNDGVWNTRASRCQIGLDSRNWCCPANKCGHNGACYDLYAEAPIYNGKLYFCNRNSNGQMVWENISKKVNLGRMIQYDHDATIRNQIITNENNKVLLDNTTFFTQTGMTKNCNQNQYRGCTYQGPFYSYQYCADYSTTFDGMFNVEVPSSVPVFISEQQLYDPYGLSYSYLNATCQSGMTCNVGSRG
ncbi:Uncharacterised protein [Candidatus Tiddalikarchaeum anstoanum]|nr:Uncharacterised protein [Candidatus Tiddalikarchaeum anstoanum]